MSTDDIRHFLVVYDVARSRAEVEDFGTDYDAALTAYGEREEQHRFDSSVEVVLLGADSLETIKKTHSSYFVQPGEHGFAQLVRDAVSKNTLPEHFEAQARRAVGAAASDPNPKRPA